MCPSVRPSVQIQFHAAPNRRCRIAPHRTRLFSEQREYLGVSIYCSTIRESLRRTASEGSTPSPRATRSDLPYISTNLPDGRSTHAHPRGAAPTGLSSSIKDYVAVRPSVQINFVAAPSRRCRIAPHLFWREGIHLLTTSYDLRQPTIRRLAKGRHSRLDPEPGADGATHPHYHTNSGTRLGAAPDRLVK